MLLPSGLLRRNRNLLAGGDGFGCRGFGFAGDRAGRALVFLGAATASSSTSIASRPFLVMRSAIGPLSSSRRQTGSEPAARTSSSRLARMSLSTAFRAASPLMFAGSSTPRSSRREAADRMMSCVSVSFDIGILRWVAAASLPPPPRPHLGHAAGGAGSRGARWCPERSHYRSVRGRMPVLSG